MRSSAIAAITFLAAAASSCALVLGDFDTKGAAGTGGSGTSSSGPTGGSSSASTSASSSGSTGCTTDGDCNDGNPCHAHTCNAGTCDNAAIPDGPVPGYVDMTVDCKTEKCVGGMEQTVADDNDVPPSGSPCVTNTCSNMNVVTNDVAQGTSCGTSETCDGMGNCVGCTKSSDCADPGTCKTVTCDSTHKCVVANAASETTCNAGGGKVCDGMGNCVACVSDTDCANGACTANMCGPAPNGHTCSMPSQCQSGHCVSGVCCSSSCNGTCMACTKALTGQPDGTCTAMTAGQQAPSGQCFPMLPCGNDGKCAAGGVCEMTPAGTACGMSMSTCFNGQFMPASTCDGMGQCSGGGQMPCPNGFACASTTACATSCPSNDANGDQSCANGYWCNGVSCQPRQMTGATCNRSSQCMTHCILSTMLCE